jgi:microsomal dipeptidase-like Zn-dependent dipeptidase
MQHNNLIRLGSRILGLGFVLALVPGVGAQPRLFNQPAGLNRTASVARVMSTAPIDGWSDYHAHQMSELGFGGGFVWGEHKGPASTALANCNGKNHGLSWVPGLLNVSVGGHGSKTQGYPTYKHWPLWKSVNHQQYWEGWLKQAHTDGLQLFVMSAVSNELVCGVIPKKHGISPVSCDDWSNIVRQIQAAHAFAAANPWYRIARSPAEARQIIDEGDLAVVLSVEASAMWGHNYSDWNIIKNRIDTLYNMGVRAMQPVHEFDNNVSGAAFFMGIFSWGTGIVKTIQAQSWIPGGPAGFIASIFKNKMKLDSNKHNLKGLTPLGQQMISYMMSKKIIIDLAHISERGFWDTVRKTEANKYYPLHVSHAHYRSIFNKGKQDEKKLSPGMINAINRSGGVVGLRTGQERTKTYNQSGVANNCQGSTRSWAQMYMLGSKGYRLIQGLALDMNGGIEQIRPRFLGSNQWNSDSAKEQWACGADVQRGLSATVVGQPEKEKRVARATSAYERARQGGRTYTNFDYVGLAHIGYVKHLFTDMRRVGVDPGQIWDSAEAYVKMWERAHSSSRGRVYKASASDSGIDHNSLVDSCKGWREKLGGYGSKPVCKRVPHFNIQRHNCSGGGKFVWKDQFNKEWCVENTSDMYKAREVVADKCPVPYTRHSNWSYGGKPVCKPIPAFKIKGKKCRKKGGFEWNGRCLWNKGYWYNSRPLK